MPDDIETLIAITKRYTTIGGYKVPVANIPYTLAREIGNVMAVGQPFAATYYDGRALRHFGLWSTDAGVDVSQVARSYGGGGSEHVAGFVVELGWDGDPDWGEAGVP